MPGCKGAHPNWVAPEIEQAILDYSLTRPTHGPLRVVQELALQGISVSAGGVWQRHDLLSKHDRLLRLEKNHWEQVIELNDEQIRLLERFSPEFRERQIEVHYTGEPVVVDTFFVGALKGMGKVYLQTVLDCYSRHAWGRLYTSKLPITSVHVLNETVLPFFETHEARVYTILSDNGREFCGPSLRAVPATGGD
ncbi:transposase InsO family protein [Aeromonas salmonicida]|nr:transposase InsO family protein [Aeromonas salmonicida]